MGIFSMFGFEKGKEVSLDAAMKEVEKPREEELSDPEKLHRLHIEEAQLRPKFWSESRNNWDGFAKLRHPVEWRRLQEVLGEIDSLSLKIQSALYKKEEGAIGGPAPDQPVLGANKTEDNWRGAA